MNVLATAASYQYASHMLSLNPEPSSMPHNVMQNVNPLLLDDTMKTTKISLPHEFF